jgi:PAS domain S-box-containing protein
MPTETAYLALLEAIATASNLTTTVEGAMQVALERVCRLMGWPVGHLYMLNRHTATMVPTNLWYLDDTRAYGPFRDVTERTHLRSGQGLPGRVMSSGQPAWITHLSTDPNFPRREVALQVGLSSAFAFPIAVGPEVVGVLEFFSPFVAEPDERIMDVMRHVGVQLGRVLERKEAEDALRNSEMRFRSVAQSANDAIVTADGSGTIVSWNRGAAAIFGYTEEEAVGKSLTILMPERYHEAHQAGMHRVETTGETHVIGHTVELEGLRKSGEEFSLELSLAMWESEGATFYSGIIRDITERKETERQIMELNAQLEQRVELRTAQLQQTNRDLQSEIAERERLEGERLAAYEQERAARARAEEAEARMSALAGALDRALAEEELLNAITTSSSGEDNLGRILESSLTYLSRAVPFTGGSIASVEGDDLVVVAAVGPYAELALGKKLPKGKGRSWQVVETRKPFMTGDLNADNLRSVSPVRSYLAVPLVWRGEAFGLLQIDSTQAHAFSEDHLRLMIKVGRALSGPIELARRYVAEREAVARAEEAVRTRDELLSVVSHDLRNPLAAILGNINLLKRRILAATPEAADGKEVAMLGRVQDAAERMVMLVDELLDFGRLQSGQPISLQIAEVDLVELVDSAVSDYQQATSRHTVTFACEEESLVCRLDAPRLDRVMGNLLSNAIKYTPGGGTITVKLRREEDWAVLEVSDPGMGIPEEEQPHIFEWFRRAENVSGRISGAGIGLATSRMIIEQHGGTILVQSQVDEGTTFTVRLTTGVMRTED